MFKYANEGLYKVELTPQQSFLV